MIDNLNVCNHVSSLIMCCCFIVIYKILYRYDTFIADYYQYGAQTRGLNFPLTMFVFAIIFYIFIYSLRVVFYLKLKSFLYSFKIRIKKFIFRKLDYINVLPQSKRPLILFNNTLDLTWVCGYFFSRKHCIFFKLRRICNFYMVFTVVRHEYLLHTSRFLDLHDQKFRSCLKTWCILVVSDRKGWHITVNANL